jgi:hypothetical protein
LSVTIPQESDAQRRLRSASNIFFAPFVRFALEMQLYVRASACVLHHLTYLLVHFS